MTSNELETWGLSIIEEVSRERVRFSDPPLEFSIFYSPIREKPVLMIIGDNPGGELNQPGLTYVPTIHEYIDPDPKKRYLLSNIMRDKILKGEKLNKILSDSIKTNRVFFRTPHLKSLNGLDKTGEITKYCRAILDKVIQKVQPQNILAESFSTFRSLSSEEKVILSKPNSTKALLLEGSYNGVKLYGINHPSRASYHKINDADWELVNEKLEELL